MYNAYFGLRDSPFSIAPNPSFLYMSTRHREALAHLMFGIRSDGGFILLTGEVGTGKTTVCRCLLEQLPEDVDIALVLNPKLTALEMLATVCDELAIDYADGNSIKSLVDALNRFLLASHQAGRKTMLVIDEAQNLSVDVLEQLRLLTNLETNQRKLLQIILLGQPELLSLLQRPELRQLSQRITARFHLDALDRNDVSDYIQHRLTVAGATGAANTLFTPSAIQRIYRLSGGIPRLINLICDRALLGAYSQNKPVVSAGIVRAAAREVLGTSSGPQAARATGRGLAIAALLASLGFGVFYSTSILTDKTPPNPVVTVVAEIEPETLATAGENPAATLKPPTVVEPDTLIGSATPASAIQALLSLWSLDNLLPPSEAPCEQLDSLGLACHEDQLTLSGIARLDRPAAIDLGTAQSPRWLALTGLDDQWLTLGTAGEPVRVDRSALDRTAPVPVVLLWRTPPQYTRTLKLGDSGPGVDWLANQLNVIETGQPASELGYLFDAPLEQRVRRFQAAKGILPDGIAGPLTWIQLNNADGMNIPRLSNSGQTPSANTPVIKDTR